MMFELDIDNPCTGKFWQEPEARDLRIFSVTLVIAVTELKSVI